MPLPPNCGSNPANNVLTADVSRVHFPVTGLGYGRRVGIWFQGCSIRCRGCIVPETWETSDYFRVSMRDLTSAIQGWVDRSDGVTISGGEPFDQPEALLRLLQWLDRRPGVRDVLVYSGYPLSRLHREHADILNLVDVLIAEPFVVNQPDERPFIGSANQRLELLSDLARERYSSNLDGFARQMGVAVIDGAILLAGVPKRGDMKSLAETLVANASVEARLTYDAV